MGTPSLTISSAHLALLDVPSELLKRPAPMSVSSLTHSTSPLLRARSTAWPTPTPSLPPTRSLSNSPSQLPSRRGSLTSSRRRQETESYQTTLDDERFDDELMRMMPGNDDYNCRDWRSKSQTLHLEPSAFGVLVPASSFG